MNFTTDQQIILASASPRRKELLELLSIPFTIQTSDVEETSVVADTVQQYVKEVALLKTRDVAKKCPNKLLIYSQSKPLSREILVCSSYFWKTLEKLYIVFKKVTEPDYFFHIMKNKEYGQ